MRDVLQERSYLEDSLVIVKVGGGGGGGGAAE